MPFPAIDIHTHLYPPSYLALLASRTKVPYLYQPPPASNPSSTSPSPSSLIDPTPAHPPNAPSPRLIILPSDDIPSLPPHSRGRPIDVSYSSITQKLKFMDAHRISKSVLSLANPWLDFLLPRDAAGWATRINDEFDALCASPEADGRLFAFACLPLRASAAEICAEVRRATGLPHIRGVILGTTGLGKGLDDPDMEDVWRALEVVGTPAFVHPHYGLPDEVFGPRRAEAGHVMPLALGFPLETTVAFTRMFVAGVFDRFPKLKLLLAHAGGAVPFLAGRVQSCVEHERHFRNAEGEVVGGPRRGVWEVMRTNVWLDAVTYGKVGTMAAVEAAGRERVLFGTDHPFFPPLDEGAVAWLSVQTNVKAVEEAFGEDKEGVGMVLGGNAVRLLGLQE